MSCKSIDFNLRGFRAGLEAVGTAVAIKHLVPTLLGLSVEITATVMAVEGRRVVFEISAKDDIERISTGTHGRFVADVNKTVERLKAKAAKLAGARSG
jgi:fluoroacetyl-CoA thioesterase